MQAALSELFRSIEMDLGTHSFCILVLKTLKEALSQYHIRSRKELDEQLFHLFELFNNTKPKYAILLDSFYKILETEAHEEQDTPIRHLLDEIDRIGASYQLEKLQLVQVAQHIDVNHKTILIHDHSHSVHDVLRKMKKQKVTFNVVVAEQDLEKTADNIAFLHNEAIDYKVVPSYMLSHIDKEIDMFFCGAVTFQENNNFVMDPGSKAIISHLHLEKKPTYIFMTTSKMTLWPLKDKSYEVYGTPQKRSHHKMPEIEFQRLKFSHDRVHLDLISKVVTEKDIYSGPEFRKTFDEYFEKRSRQRKKYLKL